MKNKLLWLATILALPQIAMAGHATDGENGNTTPPLFDIAPGALTIEYEGVDGKLGTLSLYNKLDNSYRRGDKSLTGSRDIKKSECFDTPNKEFISIQPNERVLPLFDGIGYEVLFKKEDNYKSSIFSSDSFPCYEKIGSIDTAELLNAIESYYLSIYNRSLFFLGQMDYLFDSLKLPSNAILTAKAKKIYLWTKPSTIDTTSNLINSFHEDLNVLEPFPFEELTVSIDKNAHPHLKDFSNSFEYMAYLLESGIEDVYGMDWQHRVSKKLSSLGSDFLLLDKGKSFLRKYYISIIESHEFYPRLEKDYMKQIRRTVKGSDAWKEVVQMAQKDWDQSDLKETYCSLLSIPKRDRKDLLRLILYPYIGLKLETLHVQSNCK